MSSTTRETQVAWVRAVATHMGLSVTELARRAGIAPSTLQRPLNDPDWPNLMSGRTLAAVGSVAGLQPLEFPSRARGMGEADALPFEYDGGRDAADGFDHAVRALCQGRNGRDPWMMKSFALELAGILPGDVMILDMNAQPRGGDVVCAQVYDWSGMKGETIFRLYDPPYLLTNSMRAGREKPVPVDGASVVIKGVVVTVLRNRH